MTSPLLTTVFFFISVGAVIWIIVGLISPKRVGQTRKNVLKYGGITAIVCMVLAGVFAPPLTPEQKAAMEQKKIERQLAKEQEKAESEKKESEEAQKAAEDKELQDKYDKQAQYEEWLKWKEAQELQEKYDQQAQYEEWLAWKEATEHPYMKYLKADNHPKYGDEKKSVKQFYDKANLEDYIVYSERSQNNKKNDDWLFWYDFSKDAVCEVNCALSRINGGMTLEEAMPIMLSYLPDGEVKNHKRSFYKEDKHDSSKGIYCFQFTGQLYLSAYVEDGCVSKFVINNSAPYTGKGHFDTHHYQDINYDLTPFVQ